MKYRDTIKLPGELTLNTRQSVIDTLMGLGHVIDSRPNELTFQVEADDAWGLREALSEIETCLAAEGVHYDAKRDCIEGDIDTPVSTGIWVKVPHEDAHTVAAVIESEAVARQGKSGQRVKSGGEPKWTPDFRDLLLSIATQIRDGAK